MAMTSPELTPGSGGAVDRRGRIHVVAVDHERPARVFDARRRCPGGPSRPGALRTCRRRTSSRSMRKGVSAWTFTCQVRPNWLKSLTYSPPRLTCRASKTSSRRNAHRLALGAVDVDEQLGRIGAEHGEQADQSGLGVALLEIRLSVWAWSVRGRRRRGPRS